VTRDELLRALRPALAEPASARELLQRLHVPREERVTFRRHLHALAAEGAIVAMRGHRYALPGGADHVVGVLQVHPDGYGFVTPEHDPASGDLYVPRFQLHEALHGDRVAVRQVSRRGDRRREGRVVRVLERGSTRVVGQVETDAAGRVRVVPFDRRIRGGVTVPPAETRGASAGDMVEVEITRWPTATRGPAGRVVDVLGPPDAPGVDTTVILRRHGIAEAHSPAAAAEARWTGSAVRPQDCVGRTDFRTSLAVTIDGDDARDFDDAVSVERRAGGGWTLRVHIADVAHYVQPGSALDDDARERGTSVYFPDRAVHMFPAELATGLCSLNPGVDRLVQSCVIDVDARGEPIRCAFHDGVIRSRARLTYAGVDAALSGRPHPIAVPDIVAMLTDMHGLFEVLRDRRRRRGSIDFDLPEAEIRLDEEGQIAAITASERNDAHRLIEEFMLLANESVAAALERGGGARDLPHPRSARPGQGRGLRRLHRDAGLRPRRAGRRGAAAALPAARRSRGGHRGGAAGRAPDAADHGAGALRHGECGPLRSGRARLHALHVTHQALPRPRRASAVERAARRSHERREARRARRGAP